MIPKTALQVASVLLTAMGAILGIAINNQTQAEIENNVYERVVNDFTEKTNE